MAKDFAIFAKIAIFRQIWSHCQQQQQQQRLAMPIMLIYKNLIQLRYKRSEAISRKFLVSSTMQIVSKQALSGREIGLDGQQQQQQQKQKHRHPKLSLLLRQ